MRKPETIEQAYIDFDGFFASVEQQARPALRGKPVGVVPFPDTRHTCVIAASKEAKAKGVRTGMSLDDAINVCPSIKFVPQSPDLYVRAHHALMNGIENILPIDAVCSIDELTCYLDEDHRDRPEDLAAELKAHLRDVVGPYITCSIGFAPNRQLAKIASDMDKPNGVTILNPSDLPGRLLDLELDDIPGIGSRMKRRLWRAGIYTVEDLWHTQPKHMRSLWKNVNGERFWYALHGYSLKAEPTNRRMFGHSRVLPPDWRNLENARSCARLLLTKAARRMRRARYMASGLWLSLSMQGSYWSGHTDLPFIRDDQACLSGLTTLWKRVEREVYATQKVKRLSVALCDLVPDNERQLDILYNDDVERRRWERTTEALDALNTKYGKTVISFGPWVQPPGGYAGGKIAYARIPDEEDFW